MTARVHCREAGVSFRFDRQRQVLSPTLAHLRRGGSTRWGVRGIDLDVGPGEGVALVGPTGSGKSTMLRLFAGILSADEGTVDVHGSVGTLLSTAAGLNGLLTGRENAEMVGVLYGLSRHELRSSVDAIKETSGLGDAFELPVQSYSQGMRARLGFASAAQRDVDVLLLDEVHEALDHEFRAVVAERAREVLGRGGIVVAAGHDHGALEPMCDRAVLLRRGAIVADGPFRAVTADYVAAPVAS